MARYPEWFERLDAVEEALRSAGEAQRFGRQELAAAFGVSHRDSIRLLHRFGARREANTLALDRSALLVQLGAVRQGAAYQSFLRGREQVAQHLEQARKEAAARRFRVPSPRSGSERIRFEDLPASVTWRRRAAREPGCFEIRYDDGADLMWQLAEFLAAAGANREEFFRGTDPAEPA